MTSSTLRIVLRKPADVLDLCSSLVINVETNSDEHQKDNKADNIPATSKFRASVMVRLAHYSVKEYLVSDRIRAGSAAFFSIDEEASDACIGATCLSCLLLYEKALFPTSKEFCTEFPPARYSAKFWYEHLSAIKDAVHLNSIPLAKELFLSDDKLRNWIALWDLQWDSGPGFDFEPSLDFEYQWDSKSWSQWKLGVKATGSPLYYAVLTGLKSLIEALIAVQKDKDGRVGATNDSKLKLPDSDDDSTTLYYISKHAYINAIGGILHTPIQAASWSGRMDIVELLVNSGANPNIYGGCRGGSALWAAARKGHLDVMRFLLDKGADLYEGFLFETSGGSREGRISRNDAKDLTDKEVDSRTEYWINVEMEELAKHEKIYKDVIRPSIDTNDRRAIVQCRETALCGAASSGHAEIAGFMLDCDESGVIIDLRNNSLGETALLRAAEAAHDAVVQTLLQRGALVDKTNIHGQTALMVACLAGHETIAGKLLDKGADPNRIGSYQQKPITETTRSDHERMVRLLLVKGAFMDVVRQMAGTPLRAATAMGNEPIVRLLVEHGANVDTGFPLIEAVTYGRKEIANLLVEKGADVSTVQSYDHSYGCNLYPSLLAML